MRWVKKKAVGAITGVKKKRRRKREGGEEDEEGVRKKTQEEREKRKQRGKTVEGDRDAATGRKAL